MSLLRRVLTLGTVALAGPGMAFALIPGTVVERVLDQARLADYVWLRLFGVAAIVLALFHVLILRKLEDVWWWCWAFVLFDGSSAVVAVLHVAVGLPRDSVAWPWWIYGATSAVFTALYLGGLARAGQEKPFA